MAVTGRFAPSPSGRIHLGNILCCLLAWLSARQKGGRVILRIEDLDIARCPRRYGEQMCRDIQWLGLNWDEGPVIGGPSGPYEQSRRTALYQAALRRLEAQGLVYPCFCTRKELLAASAPHASDGARVYDGRCRRLSPQEKAALWASGRSPAWRVQVPAETVSFADGNYGPQAQRLDRDCGDFILRRSDGVYAYQLAVAADDGAMGITRVVRGWDLLSSTPRQIWLLEQLGYPVPAYCHVPLLLAPDGRRLSKRDRDLDFGALRARKRPQEVLGVLAALAGLREEPGPVTAAELAAGFSWDRVARADRTLSQEDLERLFPEKDEKSGGPC